MVVYTPHTLFEFGGRLTERSGSNDIWACGVRGLDHNTQLPVPIGDLDTWMTDMAAALATWFQQSSTGIPSTAVLDYLKLNNINAAGHYAEAVTHLHQFNSGVAGGSGAVNAPSFCSVACTWETGLQRGRAHRGRIYLPNYSYIPVGSQITDADAASVSHAGENLLTQVLGVGGHASYEDYLEPQVFSAIDGTHHAITGVSVDNVYDVQRRRKNQVTSKRSPVLPLDYS